MEEKLGQKEAFPTSVQVNGEVIYQAGMSKRFYAACAALQGMLNDKDNCASDMIEYVVFKAYFFADELLKQE